MRKVEPTLSDEQHARTSLMAELTAYAVMQLLTRDQAKIQAAIK